jgi:hypothetical protein
MIQKRVLNFVLTILVLVFIIFEELVWDRFATPIINYISELKLLKRLEIYLQKVDSKIILVVFIVIFALVESLGLYAGALFLSGKPLHGAVIYAFKIPVAAFTFWMFGATKSKLLEFNWFKKSYYFTVGVIDKIKNSQIYLSIKDRSAKIKKYVKNNILNKKGTIKDRIKAIYRKFK